MFGGSGGNGGALSPDAIVGSNEAESLGGTDSADELYGLGGDDEPSGTCWAGCVSSIHRPAEGVGNSGGEPVRK
ncbi:hypothetical protein JCM17961_49610 [Endothiovibrio diazotrophicus]